MHRARSFSSKRDARSRTYAERPAAAGRPRAGGTKLLRRNYLSSTSASSIARGPEAVSAAGVALTVETRCASKSTATTVVGR